MTRDTAREIPLLRFWIGPVQGFVAQSRRTRDLWSSSYLLSYLAGAAMDAAIEAGAVVKVPSTENDRMLDALLAVRRGENVREIPEIGSLPNQFSIATEDPKGVAAAVTGRFDRAWRRIADSVWGRLEAVGRDHPQATEIWRRQRGSFWQIYWVYGTAADLHRRKSWRGHHREAEGGDKCTLMTGWQELSGYTRSTQRAEQDRFWFSVRRQLRSFDLREDERLCAIAMIKRLFPSVAKEAIGWALTEEDDVVHWPSTAHLAARPWAERVLASGDADVLGETEKYARTVKAMATPAHREESGWRKLSVQQAGVPEDHPFLSLDGGFYFENDLRLQDRTPLSASTEDAREELVKALERVTRVSAGLGLPERPSPFLGVLLLDGDHLGTLFATAEDPDRASRELGRFTRAARQLVDRSGGLTVYAGGDDLLAFVPLPSAMDIAIGLQRLYHEIMQPVTSANVSVSASLIFAHCRAPLRAVFLEAHRLLDDEAKDGNGRGSIAIAVWKTSGVTLRWVTTWEHLAGPIQGIRSLVASGEVSASFLHGQRMVMTRLAGDAPWRPGLVLQLPSEVEEEALLRAELARASDAEPADVAATAGVLARLMRPNYRDETGRSTSIPGLSTMDPVFLAHFLAVESHERRDARE